jgi:glucoside 3-dehydrogenase (cytochrome c) hitch-hiker subunit
MTDTARERAAASEPRERPAFARSASARSRRSFSGGGSAPAQRRARERVQGESEGRSPSDTIDRREAIRRAALLAGVAIAPDWLDYVARAQTPATTTYLTAAQGPLVSAAAERILPRTDTPGAIDVGVPAFIDRFYGEFMSPADRQLLVNALDEIERAAKSAHGSSFATLAAAQQDAVLRSIATAQQGRDPSPFGLLRSVTVLGYFTSEQVGRTVLHYDPVPGAYDGCVPIDQVSRRNWTT